MAFSPNWSTGYIPPATEWNGLWAGKQDVSAASVSLANMAALLAATSLTVTVTQIYLLGFYNVADGGEGGFAVGSNATPNGGTIVNDASGRTWHRLTSGQTYSWRWFGAKGDGSTLDHVAIQAAWTAAGLVGTSAYAPDNSNYLIGATLTIGNGGPGVVSTQGGAILGGASVLAPALWYTTPPCTTLTWAGGASPMIQINGPIQGWGVQNLTLNGQGVATEGVRAISAGFGKNRGLVVAGCTNINISSETVPVFGGATNTDSIHTRWEDLVLEVSTGAKGMLLTGDAGATSNTDYNVVDNFLIVLPASGVAYALYLQNCDSNQIRSGQIAGGNASCFGIALDYTGTAGNQWPSANAFIGIDTNGAVLGANQWVNIGTPSIDARENDLVVLSKDNGSTYPDLGNLTVPLPVKVGGIILEAQTATITGTNLYLPYLALATYRISLYLTVTNTGNNVTVLASIGWIDPAARTASTAAINFSSGANEPQSLVETVICTNTGGGGISYSTVVSGAVGSGQYALSITVERMS
jgi:hypothetical protein